MQHVDIQEADDCIKAVTPDDCITGNYCSIAPCESADDFKMLLELASWLKSEGTLLMALVVNSISYVVGGEIIPTPVSVFRPLRNVCIVQG